jgi:HSP20 family protein
MAGKVTKELAKTEMPGTMLSPLQEIERWFNEAWTSPFSLLTRTTWPMFSLEGFEKMLPVVDIYEEGGDVVMKADLPGVKKEDIHLDLSDNILTLSGDRKTEEKAEKGNLYRYERSHGSFSRSFELPAEVDKEKITAHLEEGVLEIRLPKTEKAGKEARKISIT